MDNIPKVFGFATATLFVVIAAIHAPGLTHHLHWKATFLWGIVAVTLAIVSAFLLSEKAPT